MADCPLEFVYCTVDTLPRPPAEVTSVDVVGSYRASAGPKFEVIVAVAVAPAGISST
jgi:hypothetical protein